MLALTDGMVCINNKPVTYKERLSQYANQETLN